MSTQQTINRTYTIMEAAKLSGLPESTLRYYETISLVDPIKRDASSKHRTYSEEDVNLVVTIACLNATGLSINDMRAYLKNRSRGAEGANEQVELLHKQKQRLAEELHFMKLRQQYVDNKIAYWKALGSSDMEQVEALKVLADAIAKELKLPKYLKVEG